MTTTDLDSAPYKDPNRPISERIEDLLARMTLEEKVAQLGSAWIYEIADGVELNLERARSRMVHGIGQITRTAGASQGTPDQVAALNNSLQRFLLEETRLGIPAIVHEESCAGFMARGATCFPQIIGAASTWNPELIEEMATVIRRQIQATGGHQTLAPVLDIAREPRWGRMEETFGEDVYLTTVLGMRYIRGLQGKGPDNQLRPGCLIATGKHFAGYGAPEGGFNWAPAHLGERELREVYLPPFEAAVKEAGLESIMNGYHELDGVPCAANRRLLTDILRDEWGFEGTVVADYVAVTMLMAYHHVAVDLADAGIQALAAGLDVELPTTEAFGQPLLDAIHAGRIDTALIDIAVRRILRQKFALGLFENPFVEPEDAPRFFDTPSDRALARTIAQQSCVLLKNEGNLLPLKKDLASIAVIGPNAHSLRNLAGDYHYPSHIEISQMLLMMQGGDASSLTPDLPEGVDPMEAEAILYRERFTPFVSVLDGIRAKVSPTTQVIYAKGCEVAGPPVISLAQGFGATFAGQGDPNVLSPGSDTAEPSEAEMAGFAEAVEAARQADVAIVAVGDKSGLVDDCTSGEFRDRASLKLPGVQEELVKAVVATGTPTVVVLINGRPPAISWLDKHVPAILEAWLPAEEGGNAIADILFGDVNPSGRLPVSMPRSEGQIPVYYSHKPSGGRSQPSGHYRELSARPLYPFGHGLSYTSFAYDDLSIEPAVIPLDGTVTVTCRVSNTGDRAGDEVVQLYVHDVLASVTRPVKELRGFRRVHLEPGETKSVRFQIAADQMAFYNRAMQRVVEPGVIEVMVGASSEDIRLHGQFEIVA